MPPPSSSRFSGPELADCAFCAGRSEGRRGYRTPRQCGGCGKPLCLACRPEVPSVPRHCPDCGGGPVLDAVRQPGEAAAALAERGLAVPFWLEVAARRAASSADAAVAE